MGISEIRNTVCKNDSKMTNGMNRSKGSMRKWFLDI